MDIEVRLRRLESRYRAALGAAVAAKANYWHRQANPVPPLPPLSGQNHAGSSWKAVSAPLPRKWASSRRSGTASRPDSFAVADPLLWWFKPFPEL